MSRAPAQPTIQGEQLRRAEKGTRARVKAAEMIAISTTPHGTIALFYGPQTPPTGWHRANGQVLQRKHYPRFAAALKASPGDTFVIPTVAGAPGGTVWWVWGPD